MKKFLSLLLSLSMAACFSACGEAPPETTGTDSAETAAPTEPVTKTVYVHTSATQSFNASVSRTEYIYDENDHLSQVVQSVDDTEFSVYSVECDENGNFVKWSALVDDREMVTEYTYDDQGRSLGTFAYTDGVLMASTEYTRNGDLLTAVVSKMPSQNMENRNEYTYDDSGILIRQDQYTNGELVSYFICTTDDQGRPILHAGYSPDGSPGISTAYTYDGNTETRTITLSDGTVTQTMILTYDENGNLLSNTVCDGEGNVISKETHTWKAIEVPIDCPRASV